MAVDARHLAQHYLRAPAGSFWRWADDGQAGAMVAIEGRFKLPQFFLGNLDRVGFQADPALVASDVILSVKDAVTVSETCHCRNLRGRKSFSASSLICGPAGSGRVQNRGQYGDFGQQKRDSHCCKSLWHKK